MKQLLFSTLSDESAGEGVAASNSGLAVFSSLLVVDSRLSGVGFFWLSGVSVGGQCW